MIIQINSNQISKLIPAVGTGSQFKYTLGNPRKVLQRVIISSIGGFISLIISAAGNQTNNFGLLVCVRESEKNSSKSNSIFYWWIYLINYKFDRRSN